MGPSGAEQDERDRSVPPLAVRGLVKGTGDAAPYPPACRGGGSGTTGRRQLGCPSGGSDGGTHPGERGRTAFGGAEVDPTRSQRDRRLAGGQAAISRSATAGLPAGARWRPPPRGTGLVPVGHRGSLGSCNVGPGLCRGSAWRQRLVSAGWRRQELPGPSRGGDPRERLASASWMRWEDALGETSGRHGGRLPNSCDAACRGARGRRPPHRRGAAGLPAAPNWYPTGEGQQACLPRRTGTRRSEAPPRGRRAPRSTPFGGAEHRQLSPGS